VTKLPPKVPFDPEKIRNKKRTIGAIAVTLLLIFTALFLLGYISSIVWVLADLFVAAIANVLLRRVGRRPI
jgi:hypothetical protein